MKHYHERACKVNLYYNVDDFIEAMNSLNIMSVYDQLYLRKAKFMFIKSIIILHLHTFLKVSNNENTVDSR